MQSGGLLPLNAGQYYSDAVEVATPQKAFERGIVFKMIDWSILLAVLIAVETGGHPNPDHAVGDRGASIGCLQIQMGVIEDVNRIYNKQYLSIDRYDRDTSKKIAKLWLTYYGKRYTQRTGLKPTYEVYCRMWNGGYRGFFERHHATNHYWSKCERYIN